MTTKCTAVGADAFCHQLRIVGAEHLCVYAGRCEIKEGGDTAPATANYPAGSMGEPVEAEGGAE